MTLGSITRIRSAWAAAMPARASSTTPAGSLISFFISGTGGLQRKVGEDRLVGNRTENATDDWSDNGNPGIGPVGIALTGDWQHEVRDPRTQVARGVDGVAGRPTQRETDGHDQEAHDQCPEAGGNVAVADRKDAEEEHEGADDLADQVGRVTTDGRTGREDGELQPWVLGDAPV